MNDRRHLSRHRVLKSAAGAAIVLLALMTPSAAAQGIGGLLDGKSTQVTVERDDVLDTSVSAFARTARRLAKLANENEDGDDVNAAAQERRVIVEDAIARFRQDADVLLTSLELDGVLTRDEASTELEKASDDALALLEDTMEAMLAGHAPPPRRGEGSDWWSHARELAHYTIVDRNRPMQWVEVILWVIGGLAVGAALSYFAAWLIKRRDGRLAAELAGALRIPLLLAVALISIGIGIDAVWLPSAISEIVAIVSQVFMALALLWFLWKLSATLATFTSDLAHRTMGGVDDEVSEVVGKVFRIFALFVFSFVVAEVFFGVDYKAFLAGLGILGLVLTFAMRDVIQDVVASFAIHTAKPFQIGSLVKFREWFGHVEGIGFRCSQIRTLDGHLVTLPNSLLVDDPIENVGVRPYVRRRFRIGITYDSGSEGVERAQEIVRGVVEDAEWNHEGTPPRVVFEEIGEYSLTLLVDYRFRGGDYWEAKENDSRVNLEILRRLEDAGLKLAFPTRTVELEGVVPEATEGIVPAKPDATRGTTRAAAGESDRRRPEASPIDPDPPESRAANTTSTGDQ